MKLLKDFALRVLSYLTGRALLIGLEWLIDRLSSLDSQL